MDYMARRIVLLGAACLIGGFLAIGASGSGDSGALNGTVRDQSGAPLPNVTVIAVDPKANTREMTVSDKKGRFELSDLPPGQYEVEALGMGHKTYVAPDVDIKEGKRQSLEITLDPGVTPLDKSVRRIRVGGNVQQANLATQVQPVYPKSALRAGISGTVILHAIIGADGTPLELRVIDFGSKPVNPELARAAVEAVQHWRYRPTLLNGDPVEIDTTISVVFTLSSP